MNPLQFLTESYSEKLRWNKFLGKSLRQVCEEYEYKDIIEFYIELTRRSKTLSGAIFKSPGMFGQGPIFAFRNTNGVDFV